MRTFDWFDDVRDFVRGLPAAQQKKIGEAIREFQDGGMPKTNAKPLHGHGHGVFEVKYQASRVVLTLKVADKVWAVYGYLKDSQENAKTRKRHERTIRQRLNDPRLLQKN